MPDQMELRVFTEPQQGATYDDLLRVALEAEALGFDAFFRSDHYLAMNTEGAPGPSDAWITLAGLARETSRLRLGSLVSPVTFRLPGPFALTVAQVDQMSGGRAELGLGERDLCLQPGHPELNLATSQARNNRAAPVRHRRSISARSSSYKPSGRASGGH